MPIISTVRNPNFVLPSPPKFREIKFYKASEIETEEVHWLWYPYIPAKKLTIIEGDPGLGKSWITCALAADISTGRKLPGQTTAMGPQKVLMLSAEDGLGDTVKPRLEALGGNMDNIFISDDHFILDEEGLLSMEDMMKKVAATIVFMDPLVAFLGAKMDMNKSNEARAMMGPLAQAAKRTGTSVVAIRHFRKNSGGKAIYSGIGSIDFSAACRSVMQVDESKAGITFMHHVKHNLSAKGDSISYRVHDGTFEWTGVYTGDVDDVKTVSTKSKKVAIAEEFLLDILKDGPHFVTDIVALGNGLGLSYTLLSRARKGIVYSEKKAGGWVWGLLDRGSIDAPIRPPASEQPSEPHAPVVELPVGELPAGVLEQARLRLAAARKEG